MKQGVSIEGQSTPSSLPRTRRRVSGALLSLCAVVLVAGATFDWLEIKTQRFYVDQNGAADNQGGVVVQRFVSTGNQITPEIISSDDSRFSFPLRLSLPHKLLFTAVPEGKCAIEVNLTSHERKIRLLSETIASAGAHSIWLSPVDGLLEFAGHGKITWLDPRVRRSFFLWPLYTFALVALATTVWRSRRSIGFSARAANWLTLAASVVICLALVEIVLRSVGPKLPRAILEVRPDVGPTPLLRRWTNSSRYQMRLRPNVRTYSQWRSGDIVQLGIADQEGAVGELHRFDVQSDAEGFSNPKVREKIDIAALGDSFTEGWVVPAAQAWPARLEKLIGLAVQNYGVPAFGPQQEFYALQDFAIRHHPRLVVFAFFAGNDLADAVSFAHWQRRSRKSAEREFHEDIVRGVNMPESFRNYEKLYLWSAASAAAQSIARRHARPHARTRPDEPESSGFENGMFHIPVRGRTMAFAWMPPHLFQLATPRSQLEQSLGWRLTRETLRDLNSTCAQNGARLLLMFVPPSPEVDWPMTEQSIGGAELERAIDFYFSAWNRMLLSPPNLGRGLVRIVNRFPPFNRAQVSADAIRANRLAQNEMLADFCRNENIPMLDLTAALQKKVESGVPAYFPDDEHWNATGHEVAAKELAGFLKNLP